MKKLFLTALMFALPFVVANAETKIAVGVAGDTYYATDNDKRVGVDSKRQLAGTNVYKDRFSTNNVLLDATVLGEGWRSYFSVAHFGDGSVVPQDLNIGINLFKGLWIEGGYYVSWEGDYTFGANKWFTESSLTESVFGLAGTYLGWGLKYHFNENLALSAGLMNNGFAVGSGFGEVNKTKSVYAKFDGTNLIDDWGLTVSFVNGNIQPDMTPYNPGNPDANPPIPPTPATPHTNATEIYLLAQGSIIKNLDGQLMGKFATISPDVDGVESGSLFSVQAMARYHFTPKIAAGVRVAYTANSEDFQNGAFTTNHFGFSGNSGLDLSVLCQYNPIPNVYLRLEGGMLNLSNADIENNAKIFKTSDTEFGASRLGVALSMGFRVSLFENTIGE